MKITREYPDDVIFEVTREALKTYNIAFRDSHVSIRLSKTSDGHRTEIVLTKEWRVGELEDAIDAEINLRNK